MNKAQFNNQIKIINSLSLKQEITHKRLNQKYVTKYRNFENSNVQYTREIGHHLLNTNIDLDMLANRDVALIVKGFEPLGEFCGELCLTGTTDNIELVRRSLGVYFVTVRESDTLGLIIRSRGRVMTSLYIREPIRHIDLMRIMPKLFQYSFGVM